MRSIIEKVKAEIQGFKELNYKFERGTILRGS
jgi:hypothetical protein